MISEKLESLLEVLDREKRCCERLISVGRCEQESLVANNVDALGDRVADMQQAVREMQELHVQRRDVVDGIAQYLDVRPDQVSLPAVADRLDPTSGQRLRERIRQLVRTGEALYATNQQTIYLINFSLNLVDRQIAAWTDALTPGNGYDAGGGTTRASDPAIVEEKA